MPTYEYRCPCGYEMDRMHSIMSLEIPKCPVCGQPMTKLISGGSGFILKGTGFYETDYKKKDTAKKAVRVHQQQERTKEQKARVDAVAHSAVLRETDAKYYNDDGSRKIVDFREDPNAKEITKIGNEVKAMKRGGVPRARIDKELNPEVAKNMRHK